MSNSLRPSLLVRIQSLQLWGLGPSMWAFVVSALALPFVMYQTLDEHTSHEALRQARSITLVATAVRSYYTSNVVGPAIRNNGVVSLSDRYHDLNGGIPIPATFSIELGNAIRDSSNTRDFEFRFVSDLPFRNRIRPTLDEFQTAALRHFRSETENPEKSGLMDDVAQEQAGYWRIERAENNSSTMRLAVPVRMESNCVACHNRHPDSPFQNWSIGDVRGIQEVAVAFDSESQLQDSKTALGYLGWFICIGFMALREHRSRVGLLKQLNDEMDQSRQSLQEKTSDLKQSIRELQTKTTVLDMAPFGILVLGQVDEGLRIQYANRAFCEAMAYASDEVKGRQHAFLFGEASDVNDVHIVDKALNERTTVEVEISTYTRSGEKRIMRWLVFPSFALDGDFLNMVVCLTDVTEMHRNEQLRKELAAELQEASKIEYLSLAIAGIAHDLNTPIGVAVTASTLIHQTSQQLLAVSQTESPEIPELRRLAERMDKSADIAWRNLERAAHLVKSFKETTVNATRAEWRSVPLSSLLESLLVTLSSVMRQARCEVILNCPPQLQIFTEPGALSQALTNLMVNAALHAFEGIDRRELRLTVQTIHGDWIRIDVSDNGRGMSDAVASKAFTPFFTTRHNLGGSGLGLFSCKRCVEQVLGGRITFETQMGQGTTFHIELPTKVVALDQAENKERNS